MRIFFMWLLALFMITAGISHFVKPEMFVAIVPSLLPAPLALVYISGVFEILGGVGLLLRQTRKAAAWGLIALFIAVFPANINMAVNQIPMGDTRAPVWFLWLRLPLQLVLIYWAWCYTREKREIII